VPGASQAGAWRTKHRLLTTNYATKSPSRRACDRSDEKLHIVRGALYSAAALSIAAATSASTPSSSPVDIHQHQSVDRTLKGDRLTHSKTARDVGSSISVEMSGRSDVVIRDRAGNILFAVDNAAHATTIGKQSGRSVPALKPNPPAEMDLPAGCEGAFSPYAEPSKARIIGRCMSSVFSRTETVS
jgi:hypothetical protein